MQLSANKKAGEHFKIKKSNPVSDSEKYHGGEYQQFTHREEDNETRQALEKESNQTKDCP